MDGGQQPWHLTFDLQPLLIVLLVVLIRRLEDTRAAGHRQLLGVHVVLHLAQRATDEGGPLPGAGEHTRRGSGCAGGSILGYKEGDPHSRSVVQVSLSSCLNGPESPLAGLFSFQHSTGRQWVLRSTQGRCHPHLQMRTLETSRETTYRGHPAQASASGNSGGR